MIYLHGAQGVFLSRPAATPIYQFGLLRRSRENYATILNYL